MLPALQGDCLWIEYGDPASPRRVLIDGGPIGAYPALEERVEAMPEGDKRLELAVISHVDGDHIEGIIRLIAEKNRDMLFNDVWFNGWRHIAPQPEVLGALQGEFLSALIHHKLGDNHWNAAKPFGGQAIVTPDEGPPPRATLAGGLRLTPLSPTRRTLETLRKEWRNKVPKDFTPGDLDRALELLKGQKRLTPKGILGGDIMNDEVEPLEKVTANNASSIALLAEYDCRRFLLLADAAPAVVAASLARLPEFVPGERLKIDAVKVAHHGSGGNTSKRLLELIECKRFLISTNGGGRPRHPHQRALEKIIGCCGPGVELHFNYRSPTTMVWADDQRQRQGGYTAHYPADDGSGICLEWQ